MIDSTEARTTAHRPGGLRRRLGAMLARASAALDGNAVASTELSRRASEPCLVADADGRVLFANDAYRELLVGDGVPDLSAVFPRQAEAGQLFPIPPRLVRPLMWTFRVHTYSNS